MHASYFISIPHKTITQPIFNMSSFSTNYSLNSSSEILNCCTQLLLARALINDAFNDSTVVFQLCWKAWKKKKRLASLWLDRKILSTFFVSIQIILLWKSLYKHIYYQQSVHSEEGGGIEQVHQQGGNHVVQAPRTSAGGEKLRTLDRHVGRRVHP